MLDYIHKKCLLLYRKYVNICQHHQPAKGGGKATLQHDIMGWRMNNMAL